jgi:hypothetical protein
MHPTLFFYLVLCQTVLLINGCSASQLYLLEETRVPEKTHKFWKNIDYSFSAGVLGVDLNELLCGYLIPCMLGS